MHNLQLARLRAVILDVDGTLYDQRRLRLGMAWLLTRRFLRAPVQGWAAARLIQAYRQAQHQLRRSPPADEHLAGAQTRLACQAAGQTVEAGALVLRQWMEQEPLALIKQHTRDGAAAFAGAVVNRGLRLGVFSDYPADDKLEATGLASLVEIVLCAQDPAVQRFKPDPRGLSLIAERLGVEPAEALYIGDQPEIDAAAARAAGMPCAIIGGRSRGEWISIRDFAELSRMLEQVPARPGSGSST